MKINYNADNQAIDKHRSLEIISTMIAETSANIDRHSAKYFLLWGYTTVAVSLFEYLSQVNQWFMPHLLWVWFLIPAVGGIGTIILIRRQKRNSATVPKSYLDRSINAVWKVFGLSFIMIYIAALVYKADILFLTSVFMGMGTAITGLICRHKVLNVAGFTGMGLSLFFPIRYMYIEDMGILCFIQQGSIISTYILYSDILWFALIFLVMMVIPGHKLQNRAKHLRNA